jgi:hypothetical protein
MCKLAIIPGIKPKHAKTAWRLARALTKPMTQNDRDGFGFMATGKSGIFGARWLDVKAALTDPSKPALTQSAKYQSVLTPDGGDANSFGTYETPTCIALHSRMATSALGITNTHPFVSPDGHTALIHNGVISNPTSFLKSTTCDSEAILTRYLDVDVGRTFTKLQDALTPLEGFYAVAVMHAKPGRPKVLDIFKDDQSQLYCVELPALDTVIFVTSVKHIKKACKSLKMRVGAVCKVNGNSAIRIDAETGAMIQAGTIKPAERTYDTPRLLSETPDYRLDDDSYAHVLDDDGPIDPIAVDELMTRNLGRTATINPLRKWGR